MTNLYKMIRHPILYYSIKKIALQFFTDEKLKRSCQQPKLQFCCCCKVVIENKDGFLKAIRELKPAHLQETLIEMTSLPSTLYVGTAIGSYKQEVICNVNI